MKQFRWGVLALGLVVYVLAPQQAWGDTITPLFFDNFESDKPDVLDSALVHWNVTAGSIDVLSAGNLCGPAGSFSQCVDLDGSGRSAGTIQTKTTFNLAPGDYRLEFDLAGANRQWPGSEINTVTVSLGAFFIEDFTLFQYDPFQRFTRDFQVTVGGPAKIVFKHAGADWIGLLLDNVSLSHVVFDPPDVVEEPAIIHTPEPGTLILLGSVLGLLGRRLRRKR